jgi:hypothetical protein
MIVHGYFPEAWPTALFGTTWSMAGTALAAVALGIALFVPDTMEVVGYKEGDAQSSWRRPLPQWLTWRPAPVWLHMVTALFIVVFINLGRVAEFLYYQF